MPQIPDIPDLSMVPPSSVRNSPLFTTFPFSRLTRNLIRSTERLIQENDLSVRSSQLTQLRALNSLKAFKRENNLRIDPHYEISPWFTIGSLCAAGSAEMALNAPFFSIVSNGLVEAATLAALVSLVNVILGFAIGYILLRYSLHVKRKHRLWTIPMSVAGVFAGVTFNLGMGSYREALKPDETYRAFQEVVEHLFTTTAGGPPLDLKSFILVVFGLAIFAFSAYKGLKHNDPYPEYANRHLHYLEADEALTETEQYIRDRVSITFDAFYEDLNEATEKSGDIAIPSPDQIKTLLDWQADLVTKMINSAKESARKKFDDEQAI